MPFWNKLEKREVTLKDSAVWRTKVVGYDWFIVGHPNNPPLYHTTTDPTDGKMYQWVATNDYRTSPTKPN